MKQLLAKHGTVAVAHVPAPKIEPDTVIVRVDHSCISIGTELAGIRSSGTPLWKRALQQPEAVKAVVKMAVSDGLPRTINRVSGQLNLGHATGYSAAGIVVEVGTGIEDLRPGDRVACAGAGSAHHAQFIRVPRNLTATVPNNLGLDHASTVTLGAIALQGLRRAAPTLGESFVVVGLGLLGQLTCQLLRANGCRVIGTDVDSTRVDLATELGMDHALDAQRSSTIRQTRQLTDGQGVDGVIITAASPSHEVVAEAFQMCRRKGRVVVVGDVGLHLNRADIYEKELDFFISTSYGPGRYDPNYESKGLDYPLAYVRWTENRNMSEYLRLLAENRIQLQPLISATYPIDQAEQAYAKLQASTTASRPLLVLLSYPAEQQTSSPHTVTNLKAAPVVPGQIRVALVGAGAFAQAVHLPNLKSLSKQFSVRAIVSRTGHTAAAIARQSEANYASTEYQSVLDDPDTDAIVICTRHDTHAELAMQALHAGKHILIEKPLALNEDHLDQIEDFFVQRQDDPTPVLLTGFNRRFSPFAERLHQLLTHRHGPMVINYRMNAGYLPQDHWVHSDEGGGRNIGEACHIYDLFTYLTNAKVTSVSAATIGGHSGHHLSSDNFVATITLDDGSLATLTYTAMGSSDFPKEQCEVFCDGVVYQLDEYRKLTAHGSKSKGLTTHHPEKGHRQELAAFAHSIQAGGDWPIPLWQQLQAMRIAFEVEKQLNRQPFESCVPSEQVRDF